MNQPLEIFVAYSNHPASIGETVETAVDYLNIEGLYHFTSWKDLDNVGRFLIGPICEAISRCDVFLCELTSLNHNVIFELGYAIAQKNIYLFFLTQT